MFKQKQPRRWHVKSMKKNKQKHDLFFRIMRIGLAQIAVSLFLVSMAYATRLPGQNLLEKQVSVNAENKSLKEVLAGIEKDTKTKFMYSPKAIRAERRISVDLDAKPLGKVLEVLLAPLSISFRVSGDFIVLSQQINTKPTSQREGDAADDTPITERTVKGKVTDEANVGLPGVNILIKGTQMGTASDAEGNYSLSIPDGQVVLVYSYVGFLTKEMPVGDKSVMNLAMQADDKQLSEVVVVGYGTVKKSDLTGSVSSVSADEIMQVKGVSNVAQALQGQAAGVQVIQRSGQPGEYVSIKIRGTNSIAGGNDPLYVVDGFPLDGLSSQLNPADIEQMEVLKDASATAIYGSRGANGVVIITTKKGREGKPKVAYSGYFGVQSLRKKVDLINAQEFATLQNEVAANDGKSLPWTEEQIRGLGKGTDWQDLVYKDANMQSHDLSVSGGSGQTKYYTSFGYYDQKGIIENSNFKRLSFRVNLDQKITEKVGLTSNLSLQHSKYFEADYPSADGGGVPFQTMVMPPTQGVYGADGKYTRFTGVSWGASNPVATAREKWTPNNSLRLIGNTELTYEIASGLKLRLNAGVDNTWSKSDVYIPSILSQGEPNGKASKSFSQALTFVNENILNYNKTFGSHALDLIAGITYQHSKSESLSSGTAGNFLTDIYQNNNIQSAVVKGQPSTGFSDYDLLSYLGRVNYNYKGRYFATFTGRYDGSSKFGSDNKFAFFPSGALAWRVSDEAFLQQVKAISNLKLRASYGLSGNQAISAYQTLSRLNNVSVIFDNAIDVGYVQGGLSNNNLKWETTGQLDIGFDLGLLNDRIQLTADYYDKKTTDLLLNVTLPPTTGFGSVLQNIGVVRNKGFEFQLSTVNTSGAVSWNSTLTFSHNRTRVEDLGKDAQGNPITYKEVGTGGNWFPMIVGQSMSQLYGYKVAGIYQTDAEAAENGEPTKKAGDYKFQNTDGNAVVDGNDRITLTHLEPKFTFGFNNTVSYIKFDLSLLFIGSYGNDIVNEFRKYNLTVNGNWTPSREAFNNRWTGPGSGNGVDRPSENSGSPIRDYANSLWVEDGSYLKLRDVTLGYNFSAEQLRFLKISSARLYVSAQNYFTLTKYSGYDPEASWVAASINGWDRGVYPSMKSLTAGVRVNF